MQNLATLHLFSVLKIHQFVASLEKHFGIYLHYYISEPQRMEICCCELFFFPLEGFSDPKQEHGGGRSKLFPKAQAINNG